MVWVGWWLVVWFGVGSYVWWVDVVCCVGDCVVCDVFVCVVYLVIGCVGGCYVCVEGCGDFYVVGYWFCCCVGDVWCVVWYWVWFCGGVCCFVCVGDVVCVVCGVCVVGWCCVCEFVVG